MNDAPSQSRARARDRATGAVIKAVRWRKRRRRAAGAASAALLIAAVLLTARFASQPVVPSAPQAPIAQNTPVNDPAQLVEPVPQSLPGPEIQIASSAGVPEIKILAPIEAPRIDIIGDTELLNALAASGRPSGLARVNGRTFLVPHADAGIAQP